MFKDWRESTLKEYLIVGTILVVLVIVYFWKPLGPGMVMSAAGGIFDTPFYYSQTPNEAKLPKNPLLFDQIYQFTPWRYFIWQSFHNGEIPLWNNLSHSGTPLLATMQAAIFYPINLILLWLPFNKYFVWSAIIRLWIAGICTYALAREYKQRKLSSLIASVSFMLSG